MSMIEVMREQLQKIVDNSIYRAAAQACGFTFEPVVFRSHSVRTDPPTLLTGELLVLRLPFRCVCDRREEWVETHDARMWDYILRDKYYDPVQCIAQFGSFDTDHLLKDGFPREFAERSGRWFWRIVRALDEEQPNHSRGSPLVLITRDPGERRA